MTTQTTDRRRSSGPLVRWIRQHYGNSRSLADALGVTPQTVSNWCTTTPLQVLKHLDTVRRDRGADPQQLTKAALGQLKHIHTNGRAKQ
jgi:hypothetical protein